MAQRVCVTGASGQAGRAVVADLREHGYDVIATDVLVTRADREDGMLQADLTDYGQAVEALNDVDAVVHLANIPAPGLSTPAVTFNSNITMNFNVFQAAAARKLGRVVWASSETTLGLPRRQAVPRRRRVRHPAGHRPRPPGPRLRARPLLARPRARLATRS